MMLHQLQRLDYEWNDNMKKTLTAIPLALLTVTLFTACGDNGRDGSDSGSYYEDHDYGYGNSDRDDRNDRDDRDDRDDRNDRDDHDISDDMSDVGDDVKDTVDDVVDGVEDAGEGIVDGAESVVDDMIDDDRETASTTAE